MGQDKARLLFPSSPGGTTLLEHALETLRSAGFTVAVAGLRGEPACSAPYVRDAFIGCGPLGGMEAALRSLAAPQPVLFVPVDLPLLPVDFLTVLWNRAQVTGAWATVPWFAGRPQPLCAVYDSRLASGIADALARGDRSVMHVLRQIVPEPRFDGFRVEALAPVHGQNHGLKHGWAEPHQWFTNLNTPADWEALQSAVVSSESGCEPFRGI